MIQSSFAMPSQRPHRVEIARRQINARVFQVGEKLRSYSRGAEASADHAALVGGFLDEFVELLHLQDLAFHPGDFTYAGDAPAAVRQTLQLDDHADGRCNLAPDARYRHRRAGHAHHLLESLDSVA